MKVFVSPLVISYHNFLVLFLLLIRCFLMYTSCVAGSALCVNDILIAYKKEKPTA
jgi:hypothetical protein